MYITSLATGKPMHASHHGDEQPASACSSPRGGDDMMFDMEGVGETNKSEAEKRLSHNEVEQRRRLQAKQHYEELRSLLPAATKADKNGLLELAILYIQSACPFAGASTHELLPHTMELEGMSVLSSLSSSVTSAAFTLPGESSMCVASMASEFHPNLTRSSATPTASAASAEMNPAAKRPLSREMRWGGGNGQEEEVKKPRLSTSLRHQDQEAADALALLSMCAVKVGSSPRHPTPQPLPCCPSPLTSFRSFTPPLFTPPLPVCPLGLPPLLVRKVTSLGSVARDA